MVASFRCAIHGHRLCGLDPDISCREVGRIPQDYLLAVALQGDARRQGKMEDLLLADHQVQTVRHCKLHIAPCERNGKDQRKTKDTGQDPSQSFLSCHGKTSSSL